MLYHISEDPNIEVFFPRKSEIYKDLGHIVWAIDEVHLVNYYFPRDCPRIIYKYSENISQEDKNKYFSNTVSDIIITLENRWYNIINNTILYKYIFEEEKFTLFDEIAGYYISKELIKPKSMYKIDNIMETLMEQDIELRFTQNLFPLKNALINSTIKEYSIIRFRNAKE
jgi:hypothetical protein